MKDLFTNIKIRKIVKTDKIHANFVIIFDFYLKDEEINSSPASVENRVL